MTTPATTAADLIRESLAESLQAIRKYRAAVLRLEVEAIHQMRIGTRKSRAILHVFRNVMDEEWAEALESELRWLAHLLGAVRDLDVMRAKLRDAAKELTLDPAERRSLAKLQRLLGTRHRQAQQAMVEGLKSERYSILMHDLHMSSLSPNLSIEAGASIEDVLLPELRSAWKSVSRDGRKLKKNDDALRFHSVRKRAKRIRYCSETLEPLLQKRSKKAHSFIGKLKKLQDTLGELQDAHVAGITLLQITQSSPNSKPYEAALQALMKHEKSEERQARGNFRKRWNAASNPSLDKWMKQ